jgi:hypothetical protein
MNADQQEIEQDVCFLIGVDRRSSAASNVLSQEL